MSESGSAASNVTAIVLGPVGMLAVLAGAVVSELFGPIALALFVVAEAIAAVLIVRRG